MKVVNVKENPDLTTSFQIKYDEFGTSPKMSIFGDDFSKIESQLIPFLGEWAPDFGPGRWCDLNDCANWAMERIVRGRKLVMDDYYVHIIKKTPKGYQSSGLTDCWVYIAIYFSKRAEELARKKNITWWDETETEMVPLNNLIFSDPTGKLNFKYNGFGKVYGHVGKPETFNYSVNPDGTWYYSGTEEVCAFLGLPIPGTQDSYKSEGGPREDWYTQAVLKITPKDGVTAADFYKLVCSLCK